MPYWHIIKPVHISTSRSPKCKIFLTRCLSAKICVRYVRRIRNRERAWQKQHRKGNSERDKTSWNKVDWNFAVLFHSAASSLLMHKTISSHQVENLPLKYKCNERTHTHADSIIDIRKKQLLMCSLLRGKKAHVLCCYKAHKCI